MGMKKWISILVISLVIIGSGAGWKYWLPQVAEFSLRETHAVNFRRFSVALLKYTDPIMRSVGRYLRTDFLPEEDEHFLYFKKTEVLAEDDSIKAANLSALSGIYKQYDGTAVANATDYDVADLLDKTIEMPRFEKGKPAVLIYHTHTTECYRNEKGITNTTDASQNVVAVGKAMAVVFEKAGYETIHLTEIFNQPKFSGAYGVSMRAVEKVLKEHPSIKVVLDVHRDSIQDGGIDYYPVTTVAGRQAAQVMIVCGTEANGLSHPNWRDNFTYALQVSRKMGQLYGEFSRPVNLRKDRFNTHFTPHTLLLEMGSSANTLDQALYAGELTAQAMIALWQE